MWVIESLLGRLLVNGITITQDWCPDEIHYVHIELAQHDCVIAEGAWSETFAETPDNMRGKFHNAADYAARYPGETPFLNCSFPHRARSKEMRWMWPCARWWRIPPRR
jgi:hypothetical protein